MASSGASRAASSGKELLEAGKRRLEEFRKQKTVEIAKKAAASSFENSQSRLENNRREQLFTPSCNLQSLRITTSAFSLPVVPSNLQRNDVLSRLEYSSSKKNDDFAALEEHIDDLTQEKFGLQRALDASRTLVESLAQENSSLIEVFNQQGSVISQLKGDLEREEEEMKAQLLLMNTLKMESDHAHLESNAADERVKMLAFEIIGLEEKVLRLRSNELKLERQLETLNDEIASNRIQISRLERERSDLKEEKILLQSKLSRAVANGNVEEHTMIKDKKNDLDGHVERVLGWMVEAFPRRLSNFYDMMMETEFLH